MHGYKKGVFGFCLVGLAVYLLLSLVPVFVGHSPRVLARGLSALGLLGGGALVLRWFLGKDLNWVSTTVGALGIVVLAVLAATGVDLALAYAYHQ